MRTQRVHLLGHGTARHHFQADRAYSCASQFLDGLPFVERVEKTDLDAPRFQQADFFERRFAHA
jgi:hypothetical protein